MAKLLYKPVGIVLGILAGFISKKIFDQVWGYIDDYEPPKPTHKHATWPKVLAAAKFVESTGKRAAIGSLADIEKIVEGAAGTNVVPA